ncbi:MAG: competence protein ComEA [Microbacteriaceae bacterium]|nr:competence protein ComEA [Microbacteriaceae bacterium]
MDPPDQIVAPRRTRLRVGLGAAVVLVLLGFGIAVLVSALGSHGSTATVSPPTSTAAPTEAPGGTLFVHILGAVERPGLYTLSDGDRAVDAIASAGGFSATADQSQLNLARLIVDGEQIYVPNIGEAPPVASSDAVGTGVGGKVNINTADAATLETLPRVGPAMAKRIVDWRAANGRFTAVEDLMSVSGVGEKTFEQLKDLVTI